MEQSIMQDLISNPNYVLRLWGKAPADDKSFASQERATRLARIDQGVRDGSYRDDDHKLDAALDPLLDDLGKTVADQDDEVEHYERFE
jgi:hypothetical protein